MIANPWVWIAALIVIGLVVGLALWLGRGAEVSIGGSGLRLRTPQPEPIDTISVAQAADISGEVGKVQGRVAEGVPRGSRPSNIDVASGMVIRSGGKVGEITGEKITGVRAAEPKRKAGG
jgi:hypothetical protein